MINAYKVSVSVCNNDSGIYLAIPMLFEGKCIDKNCVSA